jgi:hypothetical protein
VDQAISDIKQASNGGVAAGLDCIGGKDNLKIAITSFAKEGGILSLLLPPPETSSKLREEVKMQVLLLYKVGGYVRMELTTCTDQTSLSNLCQVNLLFPQSPNYTIGS